MSSVIRTPHPKAGKRFLVMAGPHMGRTFELEDWAVRAHSEPPRMILEAEQFGDPFVIGKIGGFTELMRQSELGPEVLS
jgi:hypothetical protein